MTVITRCTVRGEKRKRLRVGLQPGRPWRSSHGFTLVEVMVVMLVIGMLTATVTPTLQGTYRRFQLQGVARQLAGDIRLVQQRSLTGEDGMAKVVLDTTNYLYHVDMGILTEKVVTLPPGVGFMIPLENGTGSETLPFVLTFSPEGAPTPRGLTIYLSNAQGELVTLVVQPATGAVRMDIAS